MGTGQTGGDQYNSALRALGSHLRAERTRRRISQEQLAERIGVARTTISRIEVGTRDMQLSQLFAICDQLGLSAADFLDGAQAAAPKVENEGSTIEARAVE